LVPCGIGPLEAVQPPAERIFLAPPREPGRALRSQYLTPAHPAERHPGSAISFGSMGALPPGARVRTTEDPSVDQLLLSRCLLYEIRTRPSGPTKSFKSHGLTGKKSINGIRLSPPLITILIEDEQFRQNKNREKRCFSAACRRFVYIKI